MWDVSDPFVGLFGPLVFPYKDGDFLFDRCGVWRMSASGRLFFFYPPPRFNVRIEGCPPVTLPLIDEMWGPLKVALQIAARSRLLVFPSMPTPLQFEFGFA